MGTPSASVHLGNTRGQDLAGLRLGTEPSRFDHRVAEVVVALFGCFPRAQPHTEPERTIGPNVVSVDELLHGDGTPKSRRGGREHHHDPVAQVLYLGAARGGDCLTQG